MKAYKFIFFVGFLNLSVPFLGIPSIYETYILLTLAIITIGYGLILRAVAKEKEFNKKMSQKFDEEKTIEDVVDMVEISEEVIVSDIKVKRRGRKPKIKIEETVYE